jgi:hypothetical protein
VSDASDAKADSTIGLTKARTPWWVRSVHARPDYQLTVEFVDGTAGEVNLEPLVFADDAGVFKALRDPQLFAQAFVDYGAVTWPNGLDLAPDAMYDVIRSGGVFTPR